MIPPLAGAKSKITSRVEERKMAPERRAKLNLAFHLSFPPKRCLPTNPTQCQMFQMFSLFLPPAQLQIPESGKKKKKKKNQCHTDVFIPSCLDKRLLSSTVHIFQAESLHA